MVRGNSGDISQPILNETAPTFNVPSLSASATFWVRVSNGSCASDSRAALVTYVCDAPTVTSLSQAQNPGGSVTLSAATAGSSPITVKWYRISDAALIATGASVTVGPLSATTSYHAVASNSCGTTTSSPIRVEVPLPTPANVVAERSGAAAVAVSWTPVGGASVYVIQSRHGGIWNDVGSASAPASWFVDQALASGAVYVYRVYALDASGGSRSANSNGDLATTINFFPVTAEMDVLASHFDQLLATVNAARAAAGWTAISWSSILPSGESAPAYGVTVGAAHVTAPRMYLDQALQALGVAPRPYTDPAPAQQLIRSVHVTEIQERVQ